MLRGHPQCAVVECDLRFWVEELLREKPNPSSVEKLEWFMHLLLRKYRVEQIQICIYVHVK